MVAFYVNRIKRGKMTIDEVPNYWREAVRQECIKEGVPLE